MHYSKILPYFERRIQEEPENPELHLRFANALRKFNKYPEAVQEYEKAIVLNQNLLAVYVNLINIYIHRFVQYKENGAQEKARAYLNKARELFGSQTANLVTIADKRVAEEWLKEYEQCLS